jgi:hypothetical protein
LCPLGVPCVPTTPCSGGVSWRRCVCWSVWGRWAAWTWLPPGQASSARASLWMRCRRGRPRPRPRLPGLHFATSQLWGTRLTIVGCSTSLRLPPHPSCPFHEDHDCLYPLQLAVCNCHAVEHSFLFAWAPEALRALIMNLGDTSRVSASALQTAGRLVGPWGGGGAGALLGACSGTCMWYLPQFAAP